MNKKSSVPPPTQAVSKSVLWTLGLLTEAYVESAVGNGQTQAAARTFRPPDESIYAHFFSGVQAQQPRGSG